MLGICDRKVSEVWVVKFDLIVYVYFITTPKSVVYKFIPVDLSIDSVKFNWVCSAICGIIIPYVYCGSSC
jgi:hypothetical protein